MLRLYVTLTSPSVESAWDSYPTFIIQARYSGVYEGGSWIAIPNFNHMDELIVNYLEGEDDDAIDLVSSDMWKSVGVGKTPEQAYKMMLFKMRST